MADYEANLYKRVTPSDGLGADILMPNKSKDSNGLSKNFTPGNDIQTKWPGKDRPNKDDFGLVDIFNDYTWTLSPKDARKQVPKIELVEYKMVLSSEISGALYTLLGYESDANVAARQTGQILQDVTAGGAATLDTLKKRALSNPIVPNVAANAAGVVGKMFQGITNAIGSYRQNTTSLLPKPAEAPNTQAVNNAKANDLSSQIPSQNAELDPYVGLYAIEPTGWVYTMPYLGSGNMLDPGNNWGESNGKIQEGLGKILGAYTPGASKVASKGAGTAGTAGTGAAGSGGSFSLASLIGGLKDIGLTAQGGALLTERPKSFTGTGTDDITVTFYLLNTYRFEDIRRNWEFCFLFNYQNLANRKGINLMDPPSLYRVIIPGYKQLPIGWITKLSIENIGMTRLVDIINDEPVSADAVGPNIKMIPEAYRVTYTISSGLMNARNIFSFAENPSKIVNVRMAQ